MERMELMITGFMTCMIFKSKEIVDQIQEEAKEIGFDILVSNDTTDPRVIDALDTADREESEEGMRMFNRTLHPNEYAIISFEDSSRDHRPFWDKVDLLRPILAHSV